MVCGSSAKLDSASLHLARGLAPYENRQVQFHLCASTGGKLLHPFRSAKLDSASLHLARGLPPYENRLTQSLLCASTTWDCASLFSHCSLLSRKVYLHLSIGAGIIPIYIMNRKYKVQL